MTFSKDPFVRELQIKRHVDIFKINYRLGKFKHHMLGKHHSKETRIKISKSKLGKECPWLRGTKNPSKRPEVRLKQSLAAQNRKWSAEYKKIRSIKYTGVGNPFYGKKHSKKTRNKISVIKKFRYDNGMGYPFWLYKNIFGANNHNWNGGVSFLRYPSVFDDKLKEVVRERFGRICFLCFKGEVKRRLEVHHIDYNRQNCGLDNLVPLHAHCHCKTKNCPKKRLYWQQYFLNLLLQLT